MTASLFLLPGSVQQWTDYGHERWRRQVHYRSELIWSSTANRRSVCLRPRICPWPWTSNQSPWKRNSSPDYTSFDSNLFSGSWSSQDFHGRHSVALTFDLVTLKTFLAISGHIVIVCGKFL